jgi:hypothetical protein
MTKLMSGLAARHYPISQEITDKKIIDIFVTDQQIVDFSKKWQKK